jgi:hypothetical protein
MKKITALVVCVSVVAVLWLGCFGSEAGQLGSPSGGSLGWKPAAAQAEIADARSAHNDSIAPTAATVGVAAPPGSSQPAGRFNHLVAETSSEEAMAPPKSDASDTVVRTR